MNYENKALKKDNRISIVESTSVYSPEIDTTQPTPPKEAIPEHWHDPIPNEFTASQRAHTTILFAGLTAAHDLFTL